MGGAIYSRIFPPPTYSRIFSIRYPYKFNMKYDSILYSNVTLSDHFIQCIFLRYLEGGENILEYSPPPYIFKNMFCTIPIHIQYEIWFYALLKCYTKRSVHFMYIFTLYGKCMGGGAQYSRIFAPPYVFMSILYTIPIQIKYEIWLYTLLKCYTKRSFHSMYILTLFGGGAKYSRIFCPPPYIFKNILCTIPIQIQYEIWLYTILKCYTKRSFHSMYILTLFGGGGGKYSRIFCPPPYQIAI
jgi:hypothetical protein